MVAAIARLAKDAAWVICAGDIGRGGAVDALACLQTLNSALDGRLLFVPGNHDIWCARRAETDSWDQWRRLLAFGGNLERVNRDLGEGVVAVGTGGWYDYSLARPGPWSHEEIERKQWETLLWQDAHFARWDGSDPEVAAGFGQLLAQRLAEAGPARIVAVTHVVPFAEAVGGHPDDLRQDFVAAFLGCTAYGAAIRQAGAALAVFGHTHVRSRGQAGSVPYVCAPLGYPKEWSDQDPATEVARALVLVEI